MRWIKDVIYGLKREFGRPITLTWLNAPTMNYATGVKTQNPVSITLSRAIPLPRNQRIQFLQSIGTIKVSPLDIGEREILIDKSDVPANSLPMDTLNEVTHDDKKSIVKSVDSYPEAYLLIVKDQ
jgi:hypothetical protein